MYTVHIVFYMYYYYSFRSHSEKHDDDASHIKILQSNQMNRNETTASSLSDGHSDDGFSMTDYQKQKPRNEYTRSQLLELRHDDTNDAIEKAKNMKIAERIIKKNAEKKLAEAKCGGGDGASGKRGIVHANCGPAVKEKPKEPNPDDFWSKVTTSNRNAAGAAGGGDQNDEVNFELENPWEQSAYDDPTNFGFRTKSKGKVHDWLNSGGDKMPSQSSQYEDFLPIFPNETSNQSSSMTKRNECSNALNDTSSLVSDVSTKSAVRAQLLDKTAKLKETLSKLKQQKSK